MAYEERLARHLFPLLGWKRVEYLHPAGTSWYATDDGDGRYLDRDEEILIRYDRTAAVVGSEALNLTLNLQRMPTSRSPGAEDPPVTIRGFRGNPGVSPFVAFAEEIRVGEGIRLPWLLIPDKPTQLDWLPPESALAYDSQPVIFAGSVQAFLKALYEDGTFVNMIALEAFSVDFPYAWEKWQDCEPAFDEDAARATIAVQVTEAFAPHLLRIRQRYYSLAQIARPLDEAIWAADPVVASLAAHARQNIDLPVWLILLVVRQVHRSLYVFRRLLGWYLNHLGRRAAVPS
jgi:hypothetical protein